MAAEDAAFFVEVKKDMARGESYEQFLEKFKPKKTTDDCYTPDNIYEAVKSWAVKRYGITERIVRPFYPGGDYENEDYSGAVVVDNPPFSIYQKIIDFYLAHDIKFMLFYQTNTLFSMRRTGLCYIPCNVGITYDNGAKVNTSFTTNMGEHLIETAPELYAAIDKANKENERKQHKELPKMQYPSCVATPMRVGRLCKLGQKIIIDESEAHFTRTLDEQRKYKKNIYGGGYILSQEATARVEAARVMNVYTWHLSEREERIRKGLK